MRSTDAAERNFRDRRVAHWDANAGRGSLPPKASRAYHRRLQRLYRSLIPAGRSVAEFGSGTGDLLASFDPERALGIDFSPRMTEIARARHPELRFVCADVHELETAERFEFVVLSDLVNDVWDVQRVFDQARRVLAPGGRIVLNFYSHLWELPLKTAVALGLATPVLEQSWLAPHDVVNLLALSGCEPVRLLPEVLCPVPLPIIEPLCNRLLVKVWPFSVAALTNVMVARASDSSREGLPSVSVIVPARNESGHVDDLFARMPSMGASTEWILVEGNSTDDTRDALERAIGRHPDQRCLLLSQPGKGKGDAVRAGFAAATGDILMILDADLTVPPEQLPRFYDAIASGRGDFVNGVRLVYPMEQHAMRFFNLVANKFFGWLFSWLLGQRVKDTLCGTKVLWRRDYARIVELRTYFGDFDPFGDFELLFGAAKLSKKIVEIPIRYRERTYGDTNIRRWRDGWLLIRMAAIAARRLKCV